MKRDVNVLASLIATLLLAACGPEGDMDQDPPDEPELTAPSNGSYYNLSTYAAPTTLYVVAKDTSGAGTTNSIDLLYRNKAGTYKCTISGGVSQGATGSCNPSYHDSTTTSGEDWFYVKYSDSSTSDGFLVTEVKVLYSGKTYGPTGFEKYSGTTMSCSGCDLFGSGCNSCWIDGDGHTDCTEMRIEMDSPSEALTRCLR